ncbi:MAG: hypothetical protein KDM91_13140 [Verrucomicrobiae bacterium]|nr:hypothetical protein [Verrucomicrobiae bacterium]
MAAPAVSNIFETANASKTKKNAKEIASMSAELAALGVAHVIPDSMGGVGATIRLLREGIIVPSGPMAGSPFRMPHLADDEVEDIEKYLNIVYDYSELRLVYGDPDDMEPGSSLFFTKTSTSGGSGSSATEPTVVAAASTVETASDSESATTVAAKTYSVSAAAATSEDEELQAAYSIYSTAASVK